MWEVKEIGDTIHVIPQDDEIVHSEETAWNIKDLVTSNCKCHPRIDVENGKWMIIHSSFDGREGLEWTKEILK